jgi:pseudouridine kinase
MLNKVLVIGAQNIDIFVKGEQEYVLHDSNISDISMSFGGVGHNIALNLKRLGVDVHFMTVFGDDYFAKLSLLHLKDTGIHFQHSLYTQGTNGVYMGILDQDSDLYLGLNDMKIVSSIDIDFIKMHEAYIKGFDVIVIDNNLDKEVIEYLVHHFDAMFVMDAVSATKVYKLQDVLQNIDYLKVNMLELEELCAVTKNTVDTLGVKNLIVTNGEKEVVLRNSTKTTMNPIQVDDIVNASGAGDAFISGVVFGILNEYSDYEILDFARKVSYITLLSHDAVSEELTLKGVLEVE